MGIHGLRSTLSRTFRWICHLHTKIHCTELSRPKRKISLSPYCLGYIMPYDLCAFTNLLKSFPFAQETQFWSLIASWILLRCLLKLARVSSNLTKSVMLSDSLIS